MRNSLLLTLFTSLQLAVSHFASAASIGVNFSTDSFAVNYDLGPTDVTGVVAQQNWNNAHNSDASLANLIDSQGNSTGASVTWFHNPYATAVPTGTPTGDLLHSGIADFNGSIVVSNVPYATYDVYLYIAGGVNAGGLFFANGNTVGGNGGPYGTLNASPSFIPASGTDFGNYIDFPAINGSTLTLQGLATTGVQSVAVIDGFQIVPTPEPSTLVLAAVGMAALMGVARQRRLRRG